MKTVAVLPIKLKSERCPGKNWRTLGTLPLWRWAGNVLQALRDHGVADEIAIVSPEDLSLIDVGNGPIPWRHIPQLASAGAGEIARAISHAIPADVYCVLFATTPFLSLGSARTVVDAVKHGKAESAATVRRLNALAFVDGVPNYDLLCIPPSDQTATIDIVVSGCVAFTAELARFGMMLDAGGLRVPVPWPECCDIDTEADFAQAETIARGLRR